MNEISLAFAPKNFNMVLFSIPRCKGSREPFMPQPPRSQILAWAKILRQGSDAVSRKKLKRHRYH
jgi:hypothetical protein